MAGRLTGKSIIVTGASQGLGLAQAELFCEEGARVLLTDVLVGSGEAVAERLRNAGHDAAFRHLDVTDEAEWRTVIDHAVDRFGTLTTLVNNAGIYLAAGLLDETTATWNRMIAVDQTGVYFGMRTAMPALIASGNGAIVNISSISGRMGMLKQFGYHSAKAAVRMMSRAAAVEFAPMKVRVNSIYPGSVQAPSHAGSNSADSALVMSRTPMGHKGEPRDVAYASVYLCSDEAKFVTGAEIAVDGGLLAT